MTEPLKGFWVEIPKSIQDRLDVLEDSRVQAVQGAEAVARLLAKVEDDRREERKKKARLVLLVAKIEEDRQRLLGDGAEEDNLSREIKTTISETL